MNVNTTDYSFHQIKGGENVWPWNSGRYQQPTKIYQAELVPKYEMDILGVGISVYVILHFHEIVPSSFIILIFFSYG